MSTRRAFILAALALLAMVVLAATAQAGEQPDEFYLDQPTSAYLSNQQAGAHADFDTLFELEGDPSRLSACPYYSECLKVPWANVRDVKSELPPGLLGNPTAFPQCSAATFVEQLSIGENVEAPVCSPDSQVGWASPGVVSQGFVSFPIGSFHEPLYNLEAPGGDSHIVARFGFIAVFFPVFIDVRLDPKRGYAVTATSVNAPEPITITGVDTHFWGDPTDPSHDTERISFTQIFSCNMSCPPKPSGLPPTPFFANPTSCGPKEVATQTISYERLDGWVFDTAPLGEIDACEAVPFEPTMSVRPSTRSSGAASGLDVNLEVPQPGWKNPKGKATADLKTTVVTLPKGFYVNASVADGLGSCSEDEVGVDRNEEQIVDWKAHSAPVALSFGGQTTPRLPDYATPAEVQAALEALPNIGPGDVTVTGRHGGPWTVDFGGAFRAKDVPTITGVHTEVQRLDINAPFGGTYTLGFEGEETAPLSGNAEASEVAAALEALPSIGSGQLHVTGGITSPSGFPQPGHVFRVVFTGSLDGVDVPSITADTSELPNPYGGFGYDEYEPYFVNDVLAEGGSAPATHIVQEGGTLRFTGDDAACPQAAKIATGEIVTPLLKDPLHADFYLAKQGDNPFGSLFAGYLVAKGDGAIIKVPAKIDVDPGTGQVVTTFGDSPEQPFSDLTLHFKSGNRGLLTTPSACGTYESSYELVPWSGTPPVIGTSKFTLDENCQHDFAPGFSAGSSSPLAGAFTTFVARVTRNAGSAPLTGLAVDMPTGLAAKLAGIPYCPDAALASVPSATGSGLVEIATPSCPAAAQIGTVNAGTGSGSPFYVNGGKVYLAGPYKGAPLSVAVVVPAVAEAFDLGNEVVRVPVRLDPVTAQIRVVSDPIPTMIQGVPFDLRDLRINLDRDAFMINPTNCKPKAVTATIEGAGGVVTQASDRFQIGECAGLGFKPKISLRLKGGTRRATHPALTAIVRPRLGDANLSSISVTFPRSEILDQGHIGTVCTKVQWAANQCPAASIYGTVTATTPLLDSPLTGNVYLRSSNHTLPDLVTDLRGPANQPIRLEAAGQTDTVHGGLRNRFDSIPDAPISRIVLKLNGGKKGLLQNNTNICAHDFRATVTFGAHNGRSYGVDPKLIANCHSKARRLRHHRH
jgi:hypothetical protein